MHVNPDLLALLALREPVGSAEDHRHLAGCAACQDDLTAFETVVSVARHTSDQDILLSPPPEVWVRISDELGLQSRSGHGSGSSVNGSAVTASTAVLSTPTAPAPAPSARGLRAASLALAAALALVVGIGLGANLDQLLPGRTENPSVQLNALPRWPGSTGRATVEQDPAGNRTLVVTISSPEPATGPREVWLTNTQAEPMVSVGFLQGDSGRFPLAPEIDMAHYYLVDISQEPAKDIDPHHSGNSMLRGRLPG